MTRRRVAGFSLGYVARITIAAAIGFILLKFVIGRFLPPGGQRLVNAL